MIRAAVCLRGPGIAAAFVGLSITLSLAGAAQADDYRRLSGAEIKLLIAGKAVTDEVHYTDHFGVNGVYEGVFMNKPSTGTWKVKGNQLCIIRGSEEEDCDELWRAGSKLQRRKAGLPTVRDNIIVLAK
jgi:hypothetical protein